MFSSFNIRKLSKSKNRERELDFMSRFCARCDLIAIQKIQDSLDGLIFLQERVTSEGEFGLVVSDITGEVPGKRGMAERLAFLYRRQRVHRMELASDITIDRDPVIQKITGALNNLTNAAIKK